MPYYPTYKKSQGEITLLAMQHVPNNKIKGRRLLGNLRPFTIQKITFYNAISTLFRYKTDYIKNNIIYFIIIYNLFYIAIYGLLRC